MASITITTDAAQDSRLGPAFGAALGLTGNATPAQVKAWIIAQMQAVVQNYERDQTIRANAPAAFTPT